MSTGAPIQTRTRMFARVLGPFLAVVSLAAALRAPDLWATLPAFGENPMWTWTAGAFTLLTGLVVVAFHPHWRGPAAVCVSALGWLTVLKGAFLVAFPAASVSVADAAMGAMTWWRLGYLVFVLLGLYLSYVGWAPAPSRSTPVAGNSTGDLPHAA